MTGCGQLYTRQVEMYLELLTALIAGITNEQEGRRLLPCCPRWSVPFDGSRG